MRTTLNIDDDLMKEAKIAAIKRGTTLTAFVEELLRRALSEHDIRKPVKLAVAKGPSHPMPGIDFNRSSALLDMLDQLEFTEAHAADAAP